MARMHKLEARRTVRVAQVGALGLAVCAGALWALEVPGVNTPAAAVPVAAAPPGAPGGQERAVREQGMDRERVEDVAIRLLYASKYKQTEPSIAQNDPPPPPSPEADWKYMGVIREGRALKALVSVNGRQRVVGEGADFEGARVHTVTPEAITIEDGKGRRELRRMAASGSRVAWLRNMPGARAAATGANGQGGLAQGTITSSRSGSDLQARTLERLRRGGAAGVNGAGLAGAGAGGPEDGTSPEATPEALAKMSADADAAAVTAETVAADGTHVVLPPELEEVRQKILGAVLRGEMSQDDGEAELRRHLEERGVKVEGPLLIITPKKEPDGTPS